MRIPSLIARKLYGMTQPEAWDKGICIRCKKRPAPLKKNATFKEMLDDREYGIRALCSSCFNEMTMEK